jgi:hypothetical protein
MKWFAIALFAALAAVPVVGSAQRLVPVSNIPRVEDKAPTLWGLGGYEVIYFKRSDSKYTPFERVELADARTVEILSRAQVPPLRESDIRSEMRGGKAIITVRNYLLLELMPDDAKAEGKSMSDLAGSWTSSVRKVLMQVKPKPSQTGV